MATNKRNIHKTSLHFPKKTLKYSSITTLSSNFSRITINSIIILRGKISIRIRTATITGMNKVSPPIISTRATEEMVIKIIRRTKETTIIRPKTPTNSTLMIITKRRTIRSGEGVTRIMAVIIRVEITITIREISISLEATKVTIRQIWIAETLKAVFRDRIRLLIKLWILLKRRITIIITEKISSRLK